MLTQRHAGNPAIRGNDNEVFSVLNDNKTIWGVFANLCFQKPASANREILAKSYRDKREKRSQRQSTQILQTMTKVRSMLKISIAGVWSYRQMRPNPLD